MKSLRSASKNDFAMPGVSEAADPMEDGLRLLAKIIASAIRRANETQIMPKPLPDFHPK
jgi:hypothetical protein